MTGGACNGRDLVLVDSGACFTMVSEGFTERHGLKMTPFKDEFKGAIIEGNPPGQIVGKVSFKVQLHRELALNLRNVSVQAGNEYSFIVGCDIMSPKNN